MKNKAQREIEHKLKVFAYAQQSKSVTFTCRHFGISRDTYYRWKKNYQNRGEQGLINSKLYPSNPKLRTPLFIEEKILYLRKNYHFWPQKISWYLARHHQIKISFGGVYQLLKRNELNRLPQNERKRSTPMVRRYEKQVPEHHVQVDVKFLYLQDPGGKKIKRFQYTAIDDSTRIHALKVYERHTQQNTIDFVDHV